MANTDYPDSQTTDRRKSKKKEGTPDQPEQNRHDVPNVVNLEEEKAKRKAAEEAKERALAPDIQLLLKHFKPLGHYRSKVYFLTARDFQFLSFSANQLSQKANLMTLAPMQAWEQYFDDEETGLSGKKVDHIVNLLIRFCRAEGVFRPEQLRGRGAWNDAGRTVIHLGDRLIVDGKITEIADMDSEYVYEAAPKIHVDMDCPLPATESYWTYQFFCSLNWEHGVHGTLLSGWTAIAIACGALRWRPHVWLTGPSGCGKSWVLQSVQRLLGRFCLAAKGESSEAGFRQAMQADALPVTHDEAEGEDERTTKNMDRILGLIRQSSADVDGRILKGSADGSAIGYNFRSAFLLSAIRVPLEQRADESRFSVLSLRPNGPEDKEHFDEILEPLSNVIGSDEYASRFRARVFAHLPDLLTNIAIYSSVAGRYFQNQRIGDQVGPLMAGAFLLERDGVISPEEALQRIEQQDWSDQVNVDTESDEDKLLATILQSHTTITVDKSRMDVTIGQLIHVVQNGAEGQIFPAEANERLGHYGMTVRDNMLIVANTNLALSALLAKTPWGKGWGRILKRTPGATTRKSTMRISPGAPSTRVVKIPIHVVLGRKSH